MKPTITTTCSSPSRSTGAFSSGWRKPLAAALLVAGAAVMSGCAGLPAAQTPEQIVRELATQRWKAMLAGEFDKAYAFAAPAYRQLNTLEYYSNKRRITPVKWLAAKVFKVACEESKCSVTIELESKVMVPSFFKDNIKSGIDETWIFEDGKWWMFETL